MERVVIGANGFVGSRLADGQTGLSRTDIDLLADGAATFLRDRLADKIAVFSAFKLAKDPASLQQNMDMLAPFLEAAEVADHVVYLSSDAVYPYDGIVTERTAVSPDSIYGEMHVARENALLKKFDGSVLIARLTQIYGPGDPHSTYGPSRMLQQAKSGGPITVFGRGEERRDHIHIDDVVNSLNHLIDMRYTGVVNVATGRSRSFREVSDLIADLFGVGIEALPRVAEIKHREIDASLVQDLTGIAPRSLEAGLALEKNDV